MPYATFVDVFNTLQVYLTTIRSLLFVVFQYRFYRRYAGKVILIDFKEKRDYGGIK